MAVVSTESDGLNNLSKSEHISDAKAKKSTLRQFIPGTGEWANISAVDNGDGTYSLKTTDTSDLLTEMRIMNGAMAMRVDDTTGTIYQGWAEPGTATSAASWRIRKVVTSGTPEDTTITFADGDRSFNNIWDNRASLSYS